MKTSIQTNHLILLIITSIVVSSFGFYLFSIKIFDIFRIFDAITARNGDMISDILLLNAKISIATSITFILAGYFGTISLTKATKILLGMISDFASGKLKGFKRIETGDEIEAASDAMASLGQSLIRTTVSKGELENILNSIEDAILILDPSGSITWCNSKSESILGYTKENLLGKNIDILVSNEEIHTSFGVLSPKEFLKNKIDLYQSNTTLLTNRGNMLAAKVNTTTIFPNSEQKIVFVCHDMTSMIQEENAKSFAQAQAVSISKLAALGEMASGVAHELNNPLTVISGFTFILQDAFDKQKFSGDDFRVGLEQIQKSTLKMAKIIHGLRQYSDGPENEPAQSISILDILNSVVPFCDNRLKSHNITLDFGPDQDHQLVTVKKIQISQVFLALISNSIDAIIDLNDKWIKISTERQIDKFIIRFNDSGQRPNDTICKKIFDPFFSTKDTNTSPGLGLSIAQRVLKEHRGNLAIDMTSETTCLVVTLPIKGNLHG